MEIKDKVTYKIESALDEIIKSERLAHAYIFLGPGRDLMLASALKFAKALNCPNIDKSIEACNDCLSCKKITHSNHPDIRRISSSELSRQVKIEQIRDLIKDVHLKPIEARKKVYIITDADAMNEEASNCLLKTLEEPPKDVVIVLIAENIGSLFATIVSRCQIIKFPQDQVLEISDTDKILIDEFLKAENPFFTEELEFIKRPKQQQLKAVDLLLLYYRNALISEQNDKNIGGLLILIKDLLRAKELLFANVNSKLVAGHILDNIIKLNAE